MTVEALGMCKLCVNRGASEVLRGISASLAEQRWICIVGPNGSGKSTLLQALAGLLPFEGAIQLQGLDLRSWTAQQRAQQMAWLAQDETGGLGMRVRDVVMLGRLPHLGLLGSVSSVDAAACDQAMAQTKTLEFADRLLGELSMGQQQRVRLARALATQAPLLLLDEPLANLDSPHQLDCVRLIRSLVQQGRTVITVMHELPMALMSDEMLILQDGQLVHQGASAESATHLALENVFDQKIRVVQVQGHWVTVARA